MRSKAKSWEQNHQGISIGVQESVKISHVSGNREVKRDIGQISMVKADKSICASSLTKKDTASPSTGWCESVLGLHFLPRYLLIYYSLI